VVCDYIAGMTDNFILREYERVGGEGATEREKSIQHSAFSAQHKS